MLEINGSNLTISDTVLVARNGMRVELNPDARQRIIKSHAWVQEILSSNKPYYGINTGFGIFSDRSIATEDSLKLNRNLILSHAVGFGPPLPREVVRASMLIRANTFAIGNSGVRPEIVDTLLEMLNKGVTPIIPSQGSLGSSGDLAPLSHLALVFTTDEQNLAHESGWAYYNGQKMDGRSAMDAASIPRIILGPKEGLALTNGATFSAAIGAIACYDSTHLLDVAELSLAMSLESILGVSAAFDRRIHDARPHPGQSYVADRVRRLIEGSTLIDTGNRVQDVYSIRCAPQVQGAARDAVTHVQEVIQREINAITDNPLIFGTQDILSGGNFHGEPVALVMDYLSIAMAELGAIAERRIFQLLDSRVNTGLPPMLVDSPNEAGLNSGLMMPQYTAASLVLENQTLAAPDSVHSLPTSAEQEDHNANSMTAARHTRQIIKNITQILAIEIYCACRAIDLQIRQNPKAKMGKGINKAHRSIRKEVPYKAGDELWGLEIDQVREIIADDEFTKP